MAFPRVRSAEAVQRAVAEYDTLGPEQFHRQYGFSDALEYFLVVDGRRYPSKAILAAAQGFDYPELGPAKNEFSGGQPVQRAFERLGFSVVRVPGDAAESAEGQSGGETSPIHLVVKWSAGYEPTTIDQHRRVADRYGAVWWAIFSRNEQQSRLSAQWLNQLEGQLAVNSE